MTVTGTATPSGDRRSLVYRIALYNGLLHLVGDNKREVAELIARYVLAPYDRNGPRYSLRSWTRRQTVLAAAWLNRGLIAAAELNGQLVMLNARLRRASRPSRCRWPVSSCRYGCRRQSLTRYFAISTLS